MNIGLFGANFFKIAARAVTPLVDIELLIGAMGTIRHAYAAPCRSSYNTLGNSLYDGSSIPADMKYRMDKNCFI
jgi:hypothetical protein